MDANENPPASAAPPVESNVPAPPADAPAPPALPAPEAAAAAPPAAEVVINAERTEREVKLEQELEVEKLTRKQREQRVNQLEDENRRLKDIPKEKSKPRARWTLLHPED